ncbi:hypothetical protein DIPPA_11686 [Diplonema papillatum]|nr:hypothetical protein DIPPA_11686 [Diplonema papillatum]
MQGQGELGGIEQLEYSDAEGEEESPRARTGQGGNAVTASPEADGLPVARDPALPDQPAPGGEDAEGPVAVAGQDDTQAPSPQQQQPQQNPEGTGEALQQEEGQPPASGGQDDMLGAAFAQQQGSEPAGTPSATAHTAEQDSQQPMSEVGATPVLAPHAGGGQDAMMSAVFAQQQDPEAVEESPSAAPQQRSDAGSTPVLAPAEQEADAQQSALANRMPPPPAAGQHANPLAPPEEASAPRPSAHNSEAASPEEPSQSAELAPPEDPSALQSGQDASQRGEPPPAATPGGDAEDDDQRRPAVAPEDTPSDRAAQPAAIAENVVNISAAAAEAEGAQAEAHRDEEDDASDAGDAASGPVRARDEDEPGAMAAAGTRSSASNSANDGEESGLARVAVRRDSSDTDTNDALYDLGIASAADYLAEPLNLFGDEMDEGFAELRKHVDAIQVDEELLEGYDNFDDVVDVGQIDPQFVAEEQSHLEKMEQAEKDEEARLAKLRKAEINVRERMVKTTVLTETDRIDDEIYRLKAMTRDYELQGREGVKRLWRQLEDDLLTETRAYGGVLQLHDNTEDYTDKRWIAEWQYAPQPLVLSVHVFKGIKDRLGDGFYVLHVEMLDVLAGTPIYFLNGDQNECQGNTQPHRYLGKTYTLDMAFSETIHLVCPAALKLRSHVILQFEVWRLKSGRYCPVDTCVGWGAWPLVNANYNLQHGNFKTPIIRGAVDKNIDTFWKFQETFENDLNNWLGNIYFTIDPDRERMVKPASSNRPKRKSQVDKPQQAAKEVPPGIPHSVSALPKSTADAKHGGKQEMATYTAFGAPQPDEKGSDSDDDEEAPELAGSGSCLSMGRSVSFGGATAGFKPRPRGGEKGAGGGGFPSKLRVASPAGGAKDEKEATDQSRIIEEIADVISAESDGDEDDDDDDNTAPSSKSAPTPKHKPGQNRKPPGSPNPSASPSRLQSILRPALVSGRAVQLGESCLRKPKVAGGVSPFPSPGNPPSLHNPVSPVSQGLSASPRHALLRTPGSDGEQLTPGRADISPGRADISPMISTTLSPSAGHVQHPMIIDAESVDSSSGSDTTRPRSHRHSHTRSKATSVTSRNMSELPAPAVPGPDRKYDVSFDPFNAEGTDEVAMLGVQILAKTSFFPDLTPSNLPMAVLNKKMTVDALPNLFVTSTKKLPKAHFMQLVGNKAKDWYELTSIQEASEAVNLDHKELDAGELEVGDDRVAIGYEAKLAEFSPQNLATFAAKLPVLRKIQQIKNVSEAVAVKTEDFKVSISHRREFFKVNKLFREKLPVIESVLFFDFGVNPTGQWDKRKTVTALLFLLAAAYVRMFVHAFGLWAFLTSRNVPLEKNQWMPHQVIIEFDDDRESSFTPMYEVIAVCAGQMFGIGVVLSLVVVAISVQFIFKAFPAFFSRWVFWFSFVVVIDPLLTFFGDLALQRWRHGEAFLLYHMWAREEGSGLPGIILTLVLYTQLSMFAAVIFYKYTTAWHLNGRINDIYKRINCPESSFYIPYDMELSGKEFEQIVSNAEQWRSETGDVKKIVCEEAEDVEVCLVRERLWVLLDLSQRHPDWDSERWLQEYLNSIILERPPRSRLRHNLGSHRLGRDIMSYLKKYHPFLVQREDYLREEDTFDSYYDKEYRALKETFEPKEADLREQKMLLLRYFMPQVVAYPVHMVHSDASPQVGDDEGDEMDGTVKKQLENMKQRARKAKQNQQVENLSAEEDDTDSVCSDDFKDSSLFKLLDVQLVADLIFFETSGSLLRNFYLREYLGFTTRANKIMRLPGFSLSERYVSCAVNRVTAGFMTVYIYKADVSADATGLQKEAITRQVDRCFVFMPNGALVEAIPGGYTYDPTRHTPDFPEYWAHRTLSRHAT